MKEKELKGRKIKTGEEGGGGEGETGKRFSRSLYLVFPVRPGSRRVARVKTGADLSARRDRDVHGRSSSKEDVPLWLRTPALLSSPFSLG